MTWTETSSPTFDAVSAPASVAALTAPTSPVIVTDTSPSPTSWRPTIVTLAALTMASPAASAATYPLVSISPIALSAIFTLLLDLAFWIWVDRTDDQRVDRRRLAGEPGRRDRALGDERALAHPAAEHVEGDHPLARAVGLHLEEGAVGQFGQPARGPDAPDHGCGQHQRSFSIGTPLARARSAASGVSTAPRPSPSRWPLRAAALITASVTAPRSMRRTGADSPARSAPLTAATGPGVVRSLASLNRFRPDRSSSRWSGSRSSSRCTNAARSSSVERLTVSVIGRPFGSTSRMTSRTSARSSSSSLMTEPS